MKVAASLWCRMHIGGVGLKQSHRLRRHTIEARGAHSWPPASRVEKRTLYLASNMVKGTCHSGTRLDHMRGSFVAGCSQRHCRQDISQAVASPKDTAITIWLCQRDCRALNQACSVELAAVHHLHSVLSAQCSVLNAQCAPPTQGMQPDLRGRSAGSGWKKA